MGHFLGRKWLPRTDACPGEACHADYDDINDSHERRPPAWLAAALGELLEYMTGWNVVLCQQIVKKIDPEIGKKHHSM